MALPYVVIIFASGLSRLGINFKHQLTLKSLLHFFNVLIILMSCIICYFLLCYVVISVESVKLCHLTNTPTVIISIMHYNFWG